MPLPQGAGGDPGQGRGEGWDSRLHTMLCSPGSLSLCRGHLKGCQPPFPCAKLSNLGSGSLEVSKLSACVLERATGKCALHTFDPALPFLLAQLLVSPGATIDFFFVGTSHGGGDSKMVGIVWLGFSLQTWGKGRRTETEGSRGKGKEEERLLKTPAGLVRHFLLLPGVNCLLRQTSMKLN